MTVIDATAGSAYSSKEPLAEGRIAFRKVGSYIEGQYRNLVVIYICVVRSTCFALRRE